jgi:hypothetical protein
MPGTHIVIRLVHDWVLAPSRREQLLLVRMVHPVFGRQPLLAFHCVDTHLHLVLAREHSVAGPIARALENGLRRTITKKVAFETADLVPVADQWHLQNAFWYVLRQIEHHGLVPDPYFEASNIPDLLGLRILGDQTRTNVRNFLPRVRVTGLWQLFGGAPPEPEGCPLEALTVSAAAAVGFEQLVGKHPQIVEAKKAAIRLSRPLHGANRVGQALALGSSTVRRLAAEPVKEELLRAVRLQIALRTRPLVGGTSGFVS